MSQDLKALQVPQSTGKADSSQIDLTSAFNFSGTVQKSGTDLATTTDATPVAMTFAALPNCPIDTVAELDVIVKGTNDSDGSKTAVLRSQVAVHRGGSGAVVVDDTDDFRPRGATGTGNLLGATIAIVANGTGGDFDVILTPPAGVSAHWTGRVERR